MTSTTGKQFLDTNVLVYAFDEASSAKREAAQHLITEADPATIVVSAQVLNVSYVTGDPEARRPSRQPCSPSRST